MVLHLPQLLYFLLFTLVFALPHLVTIDKLKRFLFAARNNSYKCASFLLVCCYILYNYSYEHPYLLADNRHYVFYLWRKVLGRPVLRYLISPIYLYSIWSMNDSLKTSKSAPIDNLYNVVYFVCVTGMTVPQKLLEFRYFVLPYLFFRIHMCRPTTRALVLELIYNVFINAVTLVIFTQKTFYWSDLSEPQRIIW